MANHSGTLSQTMPMAAVSPVAEVLRIEPVD